MIVEKTIIGDNNGEYIVREYGDFENVNPIEHIKNMCIGSSISFDEEVLKSHGIKNPSKRILTKRAIKRCNKKIKLYKSIKFPKKLIHLINAKSKKEQIKHLKGLHLNIEQLYSFIFFAFENFGYKLSQYKAKHHHKGLDIKKLPKIIHIQENGEVKSIGETRLSKGQLKNVVEHRKVTISKFLDKGDSWHCFFVTFRSLKGEEKHNNGQPHFHYISDKWNIERKEVLEQLTSKKYSLPSLPHIGFHRHRQK